jgi:hypothetical protein
VYLQSTGFVRAPGGRVAVSVCSSGAVGRLVPGDVIGLVRYLREHAEARDSATEHAICADDAILDYPPSGERFRSRATVAAQRGGHPADRHFTVNRISGTGDLWVSAVVITYDGAPSYSVSIMEFSGGFVAHETQYFGGPFEPAKWRAGLAERMPGRSA